MPQADPPPPSKQREAVNKDALVVTKIITEIISKHSRETPRDIRDRVQFL